MSRFTVELHLVNKSAGNMLRLAVLLSAVSFFVCLGAQVQGDDSGETKPHMLNYANSYAGSMSGMFPGYLGGGMYPYGYGMGFGGGLGYGMSPFSMYSAGKAGKKLPNH